MPKYYIGLDQGTTGTTVLVLDENWNIVSNAYKEHTQYYPKPGWVEHDPIEIWNAVLDSIGTALKKGNIDVKDIRSIGIDNQGETVMVWDKNTGNPVYNAIVWQDRRTAEYCDTLKEKHQSVIRYKTGLLLDSYFSGTKIRWILNNVEGARKKAEMGDLIAGTLDSWLIWKFTGGKSHVTDYSTASRTMLLNIHEGRWDKEIVDILNIPERMLPEIKDSATIFGYTDDELFGCKIPISGSIVDQQSALFGQACFKQGSVKTTYGTGAFMLMNTGDKPIYSENGLLTTVAWGLNKKITFALDAGVYITGAAIQWLRDGIKIIESASITEKMAMSVKDTGGLYFVPAFVGLAAPHWDQYARGAMIGLTAGTTREHIVRATLESIAYQIKDNLDVMIKDSSINVDVMRVDGGSTANNFLMQFQADILGIPVDVPVINETTAFGAAFLSAIGVGDYSGFDDLYKSWKLKKRYEPKMSKDERESLLYKWHKAVERSKDWEEKKEI